MLKASLFRETQEHIHPQTLAQEPLDLAPRIARTSGPGIVLGSGLGTVKDVSFTPMRFETYCGVKIVFCLPRKWTRAASLYTMNGTSCPVKLNSGTNS